MTRECKNPTCTAPAGAKSYCSRRCQVKAANVAQNGRGQLPDVWVGMDTERALLERCDTLGVTLRDLIVSLLEAEIGPAVGWEQLDFGEFNASNLEAS